MTRVLLYARHGCHLCDEAREVLRAIARERTSLVVEEVDIDSDDELLKRYLERIPVIEAGGRVLSELVPDAGALRATLLHTSGR